MLSQEQKHFCRVLGLTEERGGELLANISSGYIVMMRMFGEVTPTEEQFIEACFAPELPSQEDYESAAHSFLSGKEYAVDFMVNGRTYTQLHFEDEVSECTVWSTEALKFKSLRKEEEKRVREELYKNSPESLTPSEDVIVNFEKVFYSKKDWMSTEELTEMVNRNVALPSPKEVDNGHSKAVFQPTLRREVGNGSYCRDDEFHAIEPTSNKQYTTGWAVLSVVWVMVEGTFENYNPNEAVYAEPCVESVREFEALTDEEKELIDSKLAQSFE